MHLNKQHMILFDEGSTIRGIIDAQFRKLYIHPRIVMTLRSTQSMLRMVEKNIGLSVVSRLSMQTDERVQTLQIAGLSMLRRLVLISAQERSLPPAADAFLKVLLTRAQLNQTQNDL